MIHKTKYRLGLFFLCLAGLFLSCLSVPASAATVDFSSGLAKNIVGNPLTAGDVTGIGGIGFLPTNNANASGNTVNIMGGMVNSGIYGGVHYTGNSEYASAIGNTVNVGPAFVGNPDALYVNEAMRGLWASAEPALLPPTTA